MPEFTMTETQYHALVFAVGALWGIAVRHVLPAYVRGFGAWRVRRNGRPGSERRWALMTKFEIPQYDKPLKNYLTRWRIVQTPFFAIYLHKIEAPDSRPTLHNHPWNFLSIVLRGGYTEVTSYGIVGMMMNDRRTVGVREHRHIRGFNLKRASDAHYIASLDRNPTWTLMLVGRHKQEWGFIDPDGTFTVYYEHPHAAIFDAAMKERQRARP